MIALGLIILIAGCGTAIYRDREVEKETELDKDLNDLMREITTEYNSGSGAVSISKLGISNIDLENGRSARIRVETMEGEELQIFLPDEETFLERSDNGKGSEIKKTVPVATDDGKVLPGKLEVTLIG
jgi:hypothetical protein